MSSNVIGLFANRQIANQVVTALTEYGFANRSIIRLEGSRETVATELGRKGLLDRDVSHYVQHLTHDGFLVSVRARGKHIAEATYIMNHRAHTWEMKACEANELKNDRALITTTTVAHNFDASTANFGES